MSTFRGRDTPLVRARREAFTERVARHIEKHPGCTGNQLQGAIRGDRVKILDAARDLIAAGLVVRTRDPGDRRIIRYVPAAGYEPPAEPKRCARCNRPLPAYKQRFCSELCFVRQRKKERRVENPDYAAHLRNMISRMGVRAIGDLDAVSQLDAMAKVVGQALAVAVEGCRAQGRSDAEIGQALGITRQAVWKRFPRQPEVDTETTENR